MGDPIAAPCHRGPKATRTSGKRSPRDIKWIVLHDTEGGSAEGVVKNVFASPSAKGSAHLAVDDKECWRALGNEDIPWAAPGANTFGFHIEQCGYARWSLVFWKKHIQTLRRAAYKTAFHCVRFGIPPVFITASGLKRGMQGVTTHAECTKAFGGDHTDPGPFWPRRLFMTLVRRYYREITGFNP